jgi:hypothetical protein
MLFSWRWISMNSNLFLLGGRAALSALRWRNGYIASADASRSLFDECMIESFALVFLVVPTERPEGEGV